MTQYERGWLRNAGGSDLSSARVRRGEPRTTQVGGLSDAGWVRMDTQVALARVT